LSLYSSIIRPILFRLPAESAHEFALKSVSIALSSQVLRHAVSHRTQANPVTKVSRFGLNFSNPIGLAAGFDKNGTAVQPLGALGFGFLEVGTVTNQPQPGNPKPRIFRLPRDRALLNRLGFNNFGAKQVVENLRSTSRDCVVGVNIGKSRDVPIEEAIADYLASFEAVYKVADYVAINVSSPNTPQLRELQQSRLLSDLLRSLQQRNTELAGEHSPKPLLLKIAPDLTPQDIESIVEVATHNKISGMIATNTTISREGLRTDPAKVAAFGQGGLSGAPLRERSNQIISNIYQLTRGALPIVGAGGVFTAEDAWEKICAGASLIQLYTGFIYEGPRVAYKLNQGLARIMKRAGLKSLDEAVGSGVK
jgi:dihydroorotate dehydrogenase